jgi:hypothetical protein
MTLELIDLVVTGGITEGGRTRNNIISAMVVTNNGYGSRHRNRVGAVSPERRDDPSTIGPQTSTVNVAPGGTGAAATRARPQRSLVDRLS